MALNLTPQQNYATLNKCFGGIFEYYKKAITRFNLGLIHIVSKNKNEKSEAQTNQMGKQTLTNIEYMHVIN